MEADKMERPSALRTVNPPSEAVPGVGPTNPVRSGSVPDTFGLPSKNELKEEYKALSERKPAWAVFLVVVGIMMSMFLVALDRTIVSTALPEITNEFNSLDDFGWYGSAYLLSCCAVQLLFGKLLTFFSVKYMLLLSVFAFEVASAICGVAPTSTVFIVGRSIAGFGAAGIFAGSMASMIHVVPMHHKPKLFAGMGSMQVIAQIGGPLIGGALTTHASWRWCFYLNLPIGGAAMVAIWLFLDIPQRRELADKPLKWKWKQLDIPGAILIGASSVCILLALQWGGQSYPWNNGRIIALLIIGGGCIIGFCMDQIFFPDTAIIPRHLFKNQTVVAAFFMFVFFSCSNFVFIYFIPNGFQAITHVSAAGSGIRTIPLMAGSVVGLVVGGVSTALLGYYVPGAILGAFLQSVGAGLISTWEVDSPQAKWIGYQIINGIGVGLINQIPNLAIQEVLPSEDAPIGFAVSLVGGLLLSAVFISVGENVLVNQLVSRLSKLTTSPLPAELIYKSGATTVVERLPENARADGLIAYNDSLQIVFQIGLILSCLCIPAACCLEWKSVQPPWKKKKAGEDEVENGKEGSGEGKEDG